MLQSMGLSELSSADLVVLVMFTAFLSLAAGFICDVIMHPHGFGVFGNAAILTGGGMLGLYFEATIMRHGNQLDFRTTVIACAVASTCMLLFCALARNQAIKTS